MKTQHSAGKAVHEAGGFRQSWVSHKKEFRRALTHTSRFPDKKQTCTRSLVHAGFLFDP
jgi:hypothetical protein